MTHTAERKLIVGLDIGTTKVAVLVGEMLPDGELNVIGMGSHAARGMEKGGVNDLDSVVKSLRRAVEEAEMMADCQISSVYLGVSGKHIDCRNETGMVPISDEEVTQDDVENVIHTAKSVRLSDELRVLHVLPQEFAIDYQEGIKNPVGLSGVRMEAKVHLITCHNDMARNIEKCVEKVGLQVEQLIFSALASSYAVVTEDEKELGVCVVDMGGGTMDIAIFTGGALRHTKVIPYAGNIVTSDMATAFSAPPVDAEAIKVRYGCALSRLVKKEDTIEVPSVGGRPARSLTRLQVAEVVEARYEELLSMVNDEITRVKNDLRVQGVKHQLAAGVVLTGGAVQVEGIVECAEQVFNCQVRVGEPTNVRGLSDYVQAPIYSTAIGLLQYGSTQQGRSKARERTQKTGVSSLFKRVSNWFGGQF
ncbi:MAG: cell division protein FtsA [Aeromonas sp.]